MNLDYEAWRCTDPEWDGKFCPLEGCVLRPGCQRRLGWDGTQPGPTNTEQRTAQAAGS